MVIVVDDGSSDGTCDAARAAGALIVRHDRNRGKGAALRTGMHRAHALGAEAVVTVDADGQHPAPEALMLAAHPAPKDALVLGVRNLARDGAPPESQFSNKLSNFFLSSFTGVALADTQCGLRRYPVRQTLDLGVLDDGYAFEAEVILRAVRAGWKIVQVPVAVRYPTRGERVSHFHVVKDPAKIVRRVVLTLISQNARGAAARFRDMEHRIRFRGRGG